MVDRSKTQPRSRRHAGFVLPPYLGRSPTQLVNTGASLDEVGDVLRHRSRSSTMIYARLDIDGLRSVAQPWPVAGGVQ